MTKFTLFSSLCSPCQKPVIITVNGVTGKVMGVEQEDGSGRSFNVTMKTTIVSPAGFAQVQVNKKVHVRTLD